MSLPDNYSAAERSLILREFGSLTPEYCIKMMATQPREGGFHFEDADAIVALAREHGLDVAGHTLVWVKDDKTPEWVFHDGEGPASREKVLDWMRTHIQAVVGRY